MNKVRTDMWTDESRNALGEAGRLFHSWPEAGPRGQTGISIESEIPSDFLERTEFGNLLSLEHTL